MIDVEQEADRLLALDEKGRERELLVIALRLGQQAEAVWQELRRIDAEFLDAITNHQRGDAVTPPGS